MKKQIFKVKIAKSTFMLEVKGHFFSVSKNKGEKNFLA